MFVLTECGKKTVDWFIAECRAYAKELVDAGMIDESDMYIPTIDQIMEDIESCFNNNDYYEYWTVSDDDDKGLFLSLAYGIDFVSD